MEKKFPSFFNRFLLYSTQLCKSWLFSHRWQTFGSSSALSFAAVRYVFSCFLQFGASFSSTYLYEASLENVEHQLMLPHHEQNGLCLQNPAVSNVFVYYSRHSCSTFLQCFLVTLIAPNRLLLGYRGHSNFAPIQHFHISAENYKISYMVFHLLV